MEHDEKRGLVYEKLGWEVRPYGDGYRLYDPIGLGVHYALEPEEAWKGVPDPTTDTEAGKAAAWELIVALGGGEGIKNPKAWKFCAFAKAWGCGEDMNPQLALFTAACQALGVEEEA